MNIKDAYIHGSDAVVKSINVNADKLIYKLADKEETLKTITLPTATTSANGLMSADLVKKIDNIQLTTDKKLPVLLMKQEADDSQILIPYMQNDIAYPIARGGYIKVAVDGVEKTDVTDVICNGMPDIYTIHSLTTSSVVTVEIDAVTTLYHSQYAFIIFSAYWLVPKSITLEAKTLETDEWTTVKSVTDNTSPCFACSLGTNDIIGYRYLKFTITGCPSSSLRISEIGVASYTSQGLNNIVLSKGGGEVYGNIVPYKDSNRYLGSASKAWYGVCARNLFIKRADGSMAYIGNSGNNIVVYSKENDNTKVLVFDNDNYSFRRGNNAPDIILGTSAAPWKNVFATQLTSTAADGTAPLMVSSKTMVANLNAEMWYGFKYQRRSRHDNKPYGKVVTIRIKGVNINSPITFSLVGRQDRTKSTISVRFNNSTIDAYTISSFKYYGDGRHASKLRLCKAGIETDDKGVVTASVFEIWSTEQAESFDSVATFDFHWNADSVHITQEDSPADALPDYATVEGGDTAGLWKDCTVANMDVIASSSKMLMGRSNAPLNVGNFFTPVYFNGGVPTSCSVLNNNKNFGGIPYVSAAGGLPIGKILQFHTTSDEDTNKNANLRITARDANDVNGEGLTIGGNTIASGTLKGTQTSFKVTTSGWYRIATIPSSANDIPWKDIDIIINVKNSKGDATSGACKIIYNTQSGWNSLVNNEFICIPLTATNTPPLLEVRLLNKNGSYERYIEANLRVPSGTTELEITLESKRLSKQYLCNKLIAGLTDTTGYMVAIRNANVTTSKAIGGLIADKALTADNAKYLRTVNNTNANYDCPILWGGSDTLNVNEVYSTIYRSYNGLSYNPSKKRITTGLFKGCIESVVIPTTDNQTLQYFSGYPTLGDAAGNAKEGSNADPNLWSYPKGGTGVSDTKANIQTLRFRWSGTYFHDLFMSPNYPGLWHRWVYAGTAYSWHKILESNDTYIKDGVISIGGVTMTPVTAHQDLSNYVRLDTAQTISGKKTFTGDIQFNATNVGDVTSKIVWKGGSDAAYLYYDQLEADKGKLKFEISDNTDDSIEFWWKISGSDGSVRRHYIDYNNLVITGTATATTFKGNLDWGYITNKPTSFTPSAHTHASNQITALTGYSKSTAASDLAATDSLNTALGKLEYKSDYAYDWIIGVTATDTDEYINKWSEIVGFLDSVKEGTDITDEFVTRKTSQTITGTKSFTSEVRIYGDDYGVRLFGSGEYGYLQLGQLKGDEKVHKGKITGFQSANLTSLDIHSDSSIFSGNVTASKFIKSGGTSAQFLKADGSVDSNTYATTGSLGNYVTLNTSQTISGSKTFTASANIFKGTGATMLTVDRNSTNPAWIRFMKNNSLLGYIGIDNNNNPVFLSGVSDFAIQTLLHSGNYTSYTPILNSSSTHATNTSVIYAPTTGGTAGQILKSNGSSAPTWVSGNSISVGNSDKLDNLHASDFVRTVYGYLTTSGTTYVKLGTLPASSNGTYDSFVIKGSIGGWSSTYKSYINISVTRRDSVGFLGSVQSKNTNIWDIGVNSGGELFLIFKDQYTAWSLSLHTNQGTIDYVENATPTDTTWTLLSESSNILWYSNTGVVNSAAIASKVSNALTFSAGKFVAKTYDGSSAVTVNVPTKTSHLTNDSGYLTQTDLKTYTKYYYFYTNILSSTNSWIKLMQFNHNGTYVEQPLTFNYSLRRGGDASTHVGFITIPTGPRPSGVYVTGDKTYTDKFRLYTISETATENKNSEGVVTSTTYEGTYALYFNAGSYCSGIYWDVHASSDTSLELFTSSEEAIPGEALPAGNKYITSTMGSFGGKATSADKVICQASTANTTRPIVVTDTANGLYYTTKATINYSTGNITAPTFIGNLTGNVTGSATTATRSNYLETLKQDGSGWYGNRYKFYVQWGTQTILDLKCDGYFTRVNLAKTLDATTVISAKAFSLINTTWTDTGYTFANLTTGTYAVQVTSGTNLVASGIMSVYANLSDTMGDEIPLHVYGTAGWRPYLRTSSNKLQISSDDAPKKNADGTISGTSRTVTIKIARIL